jgi:hypothetical protein
MAQHLELQFEAEGLRRERQEEEQADFSGGITHGHSGDGDGTITFRRSGPNEHRLSKGNLSCIERERCAEQLGVLVDTEELEEYDTDIEEDSEDKFERELQKWEQCMELDRSHSSRMQPITESVQVEVRAEMLGAASGPGRGANGGPGARHGGRGRQGRGTGGRGRGGRGGSCVKLNNPVLVQTMKDAIIAKGVYSKYVNKIMHFAVWVCAEHAEWFME